MDPSRHAVEHHEAESVVDEKRPCCGQKELVETVSVRCTERAAERERGPVLGNETGKAC